MGDEARCTATVDGETSEGKALLETDELLFRGGFRLAIPLREIHLAEATDGTLEVAWADERASFELGPKAARWAERIRNPPTLLDKLGVKPEHRVSLVGLEDEDDVRALLRERGVAYEEEPLPESDVILFGAASVTDLDRLPALRRMLRPTGAVWVVAPKGGREPREAQVLEAGRAAGLVDVKVARWSATHTAHKFALPKA